MTPQQRQAQNEALLDTMAKATELLDSLVKANQVENNKELIQKTIRLIRSCTNAIVPSTTEKE